MAVTMDDAELIRWVQWEWVNCRKDNCWKCIANGPGAHGPYAYGYWKENGKTRKLYIGRALPWYLQHLVNEPTAPDNMPGPIPVPKNQVPSAARKTPLPETNAGAIVAEAEAALRLPLEYSREKVRKRLWNLLDSPTLTTGVRNELLAAAAVVCKAKGWPPFAHVGRRPQKS